MLIEVLNKLFDWSGLSPTTEPRPLLISMSLSIVIFFLLKIIWVLTRIEVVRTIINFILRRYIKVFVFFISILFIINFFILIFIYLLNGNFANHTEPTIAAVSWLFQTGHPIYHKLDSPERYSLIYGPMLYLINGWVLRLFEPSILTTKISSTLAVLVALVLMFFILRRNCSLPITTFYCAYMTLALLCFGSIIYTVRSDSLILMFVSLGLLGVFRANPWIATFSSALALGISINLKLSAIFYFLPIYILLHLRYGWYYTASSLVGSSVVALAPFCLPNVSLINYILWVQQVSKHGFLIDQFKQNLEWSLYLLAPILVTLVCGLCNKNTNFISFYFEYKIYIITLILSTIMVVLIAAKPGSGVHHLIPFIPLYIHLFSLITTKIPYILDLDCENQSIFQLIISIFLAFYLAAIQTGLVKEVLTIDYLNSIPAADILADITNVQKLHIGQAIEMGYGTNDDYYFTFYRPVLVFDGNPYLVDADALMDMQKANLNIPNKTLDVLRSCRTKIWLIPKNKPPFQQPNYYPPNQQIFSDVFKKLFLDKYKKIEQTKYYDLWFCKDKSSG